MTEVKVENPNYKVVRVKENKTVYPLYYHQTQALEKLTVLNRNKRFRTLLVLPTGAGKTRTAVHWLLRYAVDERKKVLWIAHRHLLIEQAADGFERYTTKDMLYKESSFSYRLVSGKHDYAIRIKKEDNVLLATKDTIAKNLKSLDQWLDGEEVYLVIDEAHHSTAKSYRMIIDYVEQKSATMKLLGLTATPFRTLESEKGYLEKIYQDQTVYEIGLKELIGKGILSTPVFEEYNTSMKLGSEVGVRGLRSITEMDRIPDEVLKFMAENRDRNHMIVKQYMDHYQKYGQTLVFALNRVHAVQLNKLFNQKGDKLSIKSDFVVSGLTDEFLGIDRSNEKNEKAIEDFRNGDIQVLINVNILTEGTDLPQTKTVFLTRPTVSKVLMTQMVGRALRGEKAGGTKDAYIVSFIDDWEDKISWENPEMIMASDEIHDVSPVERKKLQYQLISLAQIEFAASYLDGTVDIEKFSKVPFKEKIPVGMYVFSLVDEFNLESSHQILVYSSTKETYSKLMEDLPKIFEEYQLEEENIEPEKLENLTKNLYTIYFAGGLVPPFKEKDLSTLFQYYAQKGIIPAFIPIETDYPIDLSLVAKEIVERNMTVMDKKRYIENLWKDETTLLKAYYGRLILLLAQLEPEINKLLESDTFIQTSGSNNEIKDNEIINCSELSIYEMMQVCPEKAMELKKQVFSKAMTADGSYRCAMCGKISKTIGLFQIDHIHPMSKGGLTIPENLQLLCTSCNRKKGNRI